MNHTIIELENKMCAEKIELSVHVLQLRGSAAACVSKLQNFNSFALMRNTKGGDRWSTFEGKFHPEIRELQRRIIIIKLRLLFYKVHAQGFFFCVRKLSQVEVQNYKLL